MRVNGGMEHDYPTLDVESSPNHTAEVVRGGAGIAGIAGIGDKVTSTPGSLILTSSKAVR